MSNPQVNPAIYQAMQYRCIGPHRGGRVVAVAGDPAHDTVFYFGSTGGGVWKTVDGGVSWRNVSDGYFNTASVGALSVAHSDPNVIYAGMGETSIRSNVSRGDGVYKSTDAGKTWQHCGLAETQNIGEIQIHPDNPDLVYVAALGHVWGPNAERGVYRSQDGGRTWAKVLYKSDKAGAVDLSMDPTNPRILYAAIWEAGRGPHYMSSGGEDSGMLRSTDGGDTWQEISHNAGLPQGTLGKIGVAASAAKPGRVWAIVEAEDGAVFRSDDYGETWTRGSEDRNLRQRAWYYHHICADPQDENTVWVMNVALWKSVDAGRTFSQYPCQHGDTHDLWIDPNNPGRMILGDDGGAEVSFNGGVGWSTIYNQPTAEFYHVTTDTRTPYRVYGAQQDNTTMSVPSRSNTGVITEPEWYDIGGGESGYIAVRPDNPDIVFAGSYGGLLTRYDASTRLATSVNVWPEMTLGSPAQDMKYRFQWTSPTIISPHDPNVVYHGGNHVFRSTDEGQSWQQISPDLSRGDPETLVASGGPITKDNTGAETYATVFALAESPVEQGVLWAGSDDGLIHLSRDGGANWTNVTPGPDLLPEWALISIIDPSPHDAGTAYVAATRYKSHDDRPYLLKTGDFGESWTPITGGIPEHEFTRVIREDPEVRGLLFAGTERGLYVSFDDGGQWQSLQRDPSHPLGTGLPVVPIHDFVVHENDLVIATHGRAFWILDDIGPLRQIAKGEVGDDSQVILYQPGPTRRWASASRFSRPPVPGRNYFRAGGVVTSFEHRATPEGEPENVMLDAGDNPPDGVVLRYYLSEEPEEDVTLTIRDERGTEIRSFSSKKEDEQDARQSGTRRKKEPRVHKQAGSNQFVWDMRYPGTTEITDDTGSLGFAGMIPTGPKVPPGTYRAELTVGNQSLSQSFEILPDPRTGASDGDYQEQFDFGLRIRDKLTELNEGINRLRRIRQDVDSWLARVDDENIRKTGDEIKEKLRAVEDELVQWRATSVQDTLNFPVRVNAKLAWLAGVVGGAEGRPTRQSYDVFDDLAARTDAQLRRLNEIVRDDVARFNEQIKESGTPAVSA